MRFFAKSPMLIGARPLWCALGLIVVLAGRPALDAQTAPSSAGPTIEDVLAAKARRTPAQRKVSSHLLDAAEAARARQVSAAAAVDATDPARIATVNPASESVAVDIRADATAEVLARIEALGGRVINDVPKYRAIRAQLPLEAVERLAELADVQFIRPASHPSPSGPQSGESAAAPKPTRVAARSLADDPTPGDTAHQADAARQTYSVDGTGIGIGVVASGIDELELYQARGRLPDRIHVPTGQRGSGRGGSLSLWMLHTVAPGAELYFATSSGGEAALAANIEALCSAGADIIVTGSHYRQEPAFQDGPVARGVNAAVDDGCFVFAPSGWAGNLNDGTSGVWEGDYSTGSAFASVGTAHDFGSGVEKNRILEVTPSAWILQWADPLGGSTNDYDLFLVNDGGTVLASSTDVQNGAQDPIESIPWQRAAGTMHLVVVKKTSAAARYIRLNSVSGGRLEEATAGQTYGHFAAEKSVTVAQVDLATAGGAGGTFNGTETVLTTSSDGPRRVFFQADGTAITDSDFSSTGGKLVNKPDLGAAADADAYLASGALYAAGIGALALEAAGGPTNVSAAALRTALTGAALDIEATGADRDSGAGVTMAPAAVDAVDVSAADRNGAPTAGTPVTATMARNGQPKEVSLASLFTDPDNDTLTLSVVPSSTLRVSASISATTLTLTPVISGRAEVPIRATDPEGLSAIGFVAVEINEGSLDYDTDDDGLIEINNLAQLDAMRYDRDADGTVDDAADWSSYNTAFPQAQLDMGCSAGCQGYELAEDLDFDTNGNGSADAGDSYWNGGAGWDPVDFRATFDGNGHSLSGLFVRRTGALARAALFGTFGGDLRDVALSDVDVRGGPRGVASLVLWHTGSISGCSATGSVSTTGVMAAGHVATAGGLVAVNWGEISNSSAAVEVTGEEQAGGLVGRNQGTITKSSGTGHVSGTTHVGGLVGKNYGLVSMNYATGDATGTTNVGGLVGYNAAVQTGSTSDLIERSFATGSVTGNDYTGGLVGLNNGAVSATYSTGRVLGELNAAGLVGGSQALSPAFVDDYDVAVIRDSYTTSPVNQALGYLHAFSGLGNSTNSTIEASYYDQTLSWFRTPVASDRGRSTSVLQAPTTASDIYADWSTSEWDFGTSSHYPALAADIDGDNTATWQEFGHQVRQAPTVTVVQGSSRNNLQFSWTPVDTSPWSPAPAITYTLYTINYDYAVTRDFTGFSATHSGLRPGSTYTYLLVALVDGGEAVRTAPITWTLNNRAPTAVGILENQVLRLGDSPPLVPIADAFEEPDQDPLIYAGSPSDSSVVVVAASASGLTLTPLNVGSSTIAVTATDPYGLSASLDFDVTVVRPPGVSLSPTVLNLPEGETKTYVVVLHAEPTDTVTVTPVVPAGQGVSVSPPSLAFGTRSWNRTMTLTVITDRDENAVTEAPVTITHTVSGGGYDDVSVNTVTVNIAETNSRGLSLSERGMRVEEGTSKRYSVALMSEPTDDVEVAVQVEGPNPDVSVDKDSLEFTPLDWDQEQEVEVSVVDDSDTIEQGSVTIRHTVRGGDYTSVKAPSMVVIPVENDEQTALVDVPRAVESATALVFEVGPRSQTTADMVVNYRTQDTNTGRAVATAGSDYTATSGSLTFPTGTTARRTVAVPLIDDEEDEEEVETLTLILEVSSGTGDPKEQSSIGFIEDDDDPVVAVTFDRATYDVTEGAQVNITARLSADPERLIQIPLVTSHHGGATELDYSGLPSSLVFISGETTQTISFEAVDDHEDDDGEAVVLSLGPLPDRVTGNPEATLAVRDNDGSGTGGPGDGGGGGGPAGGGTPPPSDGDNDDGGTGGDSGQPASGPPTASITTDAECSDDLCRTRTGVRVSFRDTSSGAVRSRLWQFSDGRRTRTPSFDHTWSEPGFYEVTLWVSNDSEESTTSLTFLVEASEPAGTCVADAETLCLQDSRFEVGVAWWTADGKTGMGSVVRAGTNDSGLFTFFHRDNWEVLIKVLDGCALNGHVWVYGASTTDLGYRIEVTDTVSGTVKEYRNEPGLPAPAITDATAFADSCRP